MLTCSGTNISQLLPAFIVAFNNKGEGGDRRVQRIAVTMEIHANPDSAHDLATQMREEPIAFLAKKANTINPSW